MSVFSRKFKLKCATRYVRQLSRSFATTSQVADSQIDNSKAIKLIKYLHINHRKKGKHTYKAIEEALNIYNKITEPPSTETINQILRIFQQF